MYEKVLTYQNALEESATAQIAKYLVDRSRDHYWEGTASMMIEFSFRDDDFYIETDKDEALKKQIRGNLSFPRNATALGIQLNRAESTLKSLGIEVEHSNSKHSIYKNGSRWITLRATDGYEADETLRDGLEDWENSLSS